MALKGITQKWGNILILIAAFLAGMALGAAGFAVWRQAQPTPMFHIDPAQVTQIILRGEHYDTIQLEESRFEEVVAMFNDFSYYATEYQAPASGWSNYIQIVTREGVVAIDFGTSLGGEYDYVKIGNPDSSKTIYLTELGYFQPLLELARMEDGGSEE